MSELKVTGRVVATTPIQKGVSGSGKEWQKQEIVIETEEQFPKNICFTAFGDKTNLLNGLTNGTLVEVYFNAESKEFKGKWFTNLNLWKIVGLQSGNGNSAASATHQATNDKSDDEPTDDLPF